ncbi:hypothetical protein CTE07_29910 [Chitinophaga terrae (ex Kim and Jung 2007)]|nr:hypothetical protein CTE07_29910 [Chitinophaga terrae (ex Kim and Jung 2007)]
MAAASNTGITVLIVHSLSRSSNARHIATRGVPKQAAIAATVPQWYNRTFEPNNGLIALLNPKTADSNPKGMPALTPTDIPKNRNRAGANLEISIQAMVAGRGA